MQIDTKPQAARKIIDAGIPKNISAADKEALLKKWDDEARVRNEAVALGNRIPSEATLTLRFQLRKFGKHWNAYATNSNGKYVPLLNAPSLLASAIEALSDRMTDEALRS